MAESELKKVQSKLSENDWVFTVGHHEIGGECDS